MIPGAAISRLDFFEGLTERQLERIGRICSQQEYRQEETIFQEGEKGDHLYILAEGNARIVKFVSSQFDEALLYLSEGDVFGEMSFIDGRPRSSHAIAITDCKAFSVSRTEMDRIVKEDPRVGLKLFARIAAIAAERLRIINDKFKQAILRGLEMSGAQAMALHYVMTERLEIEVDLKNGRSWSGRIMLVHRGEGGYEVTIKDAQGRLHILPYHAINFLSSLP